MTSKKLINEWEWLTEGVDNFQQKLDLSILLQNAKETMILENRLPEQYLEGLLNEDVETTNMLHVNGADANELIPKVVFPLIRRVFPNLIANKLVGIQPLTRPTGIIYYLVYKFSNTKGDVVAQDEYDAFPWDGDPRKGYSAYYSMNKIGAFTGIVAAAGAQTTVSTNHATFFLQSEVGTVASTKSITGIEIYNITTGQAYTGARIVSAFSGADAREILINPAVDNITIEDVAAGGVAPWAAGDRIKVFLIYNQEGSEKMPEMELTVDSIPVSTKQRKLRVKWTKESEQDFKAYHSIDIENELVKAASQEMTYEIDREIIDFIEQNTLPELSMYHDWTADQPTNGNNTQGNYLDRHRALADKIMRLSAKIATYNRQGPATWIVCSPQTAAVLAQLPSFTTEIGGAGSNYSVKYMGKLYGNIEVYADPVRGFSVGSGGNKTFSDTILMGFKDGNNPYASGIIYSPYTNWMSNTIIHPDNFNSVRGFFTRYALTKVIRGSYYYGKLTVDNLIV